MSHVQIFDTTLRDGEQSPGFSMNTAEKIRMAHQLAALGVDVIEAGFPIASQGDLEAVLAAVVQGKVAGGKEAHGAPPLTYFAVFWLTAWPIPGTAWPRRIWRTSPRRCPGIWGAG